MPSDRLIATTREPKLVLGELAVLNVAATGKIGAFLDWGLEKDLFLPFKQQTRRLHPGDEVLVSLYIDKSDLRLMLSAPLQRRRRSEPAVLW